MERLAMLCAVIERRSSRVGVVAGDEAEVVRGREVASGTFRLREGCEKEREWCGTGGGVGEARGGDGGTGGVND